MWICEEGGRCVDPCDDCEHYIEVEIVRHGEWVGRRGNGGYDDYYCSICGVYEEGTNNPKFLGKYCPNCGAKMDGGKE